ncbi:30S ribosomal protein S15 [Dehalococcoides sp. THU3]|uniref:Small ribosomal subunit protein uS15 n=1 Tax=Dehalococcoides mccartyi TaxID=61435 RepID=A0AB33HQ57_9CHLR|nr:MULTISPECIES: 30S ribosomal protein S15 [Dehalococcoides]MDD5487127.1 30S ribosomal protein S15 [Dehalococcoidales bacterium]BAQ34766.1 30S ribosomal protein S15 [Dehalococcoides sp. UCH007]BAZ97426.1 30S ribosomal protein S15 [Dehalococcoides mccartyi]
MDKQEKSLIINEFKKSENDTGSTEVQVALLTARIHQLTTHMISNKHDFHTKRSLLTLVGRRRRLLSYMRNNNGAGYQELIANLGLRK